MNNNNINIDRAVNIKSISDKNIKKYKLADNNTNFQVNDLIFLYDDNYVEITNNNQLLKHKIDKYNKVYRKK